MQHQRTVYRSCTTNIKRRIDEHDELVVKGRDALAAVANLHLRLLQLQSVVDADATLRDSSAGAAASSAMLYSMLRERDVLDHAVDQMLQNAAQLEQAQSRLQQLATEASSSNKPLFTCLTMQQISKLLAQALAGCHEQVQVCKPAPPEGALSQCASSALAAPCTSSQPRWQLARLVHSTCIANAEDGLHRRCECAGLLRHPEGLQPCSAAA